MGTTLAAGESSQYLSALLMAALRAAVEAIRRTKDDVGELHEVFVVDSKGRLAGWVTERDYRRALALLAKNTIELGAATARVDSNKCAACLVCVRACPFDIPFINADGYSEIDPAKCHGCGVCAAECPAKAIQLMQFEDDQILAKLDGLLERMVA